MLTIRVGGVWVHHIAAYADVSFSHEWPHGSAQASWAMPFGIRHQALVAGALVEVFDGGERIWRGRLSEPSASGEYNAVGSWQEAKGVWALTGAGVATNIPDTAVDAAKPTTGRSAVSWTRPVSLSAVSWGTAGEPLELVTLLDEASASLSKRWWVDPDGAVRFSSDPTTPSYYVPHAVGGQGLGLADDNYFTHLIGRYMSGVGTFDTVTVGSGTPRKEGLVDLTLMGIISGGTATTELNSRLALVGARMGFSEGLQLSYGQVTTPGGTPVALTTPRAGEMVRLMGVTDETRPGAILPYLDIVIGENAYRSTDESLSIKPVGLEARSFTDVLKVAVSR